MKPRHDLSRLILALWLTASACFAAEPPTLVLNEINTTPEWQKFFQTLATEAFRRSGLDIKFVKLPAERALLLANSGEYDGDLFRPAGIEGQYTNLARVPEKLADLELIAMSKDPSIPASFAAIRERSVGYIRGWRVYEEAMAGAKNVTTVIDHEQLFRLLQLDRIEVALVARWRYMNLAPQRMPGSEHFTVLEPALSKRDTFIYLNLRHAAHMPRIAAALRAMRQDGFVQRAEKEILLPALKGGR
jgi:polar amino acid transport system substrate-binding protein